MVQYCMQAERKVPHTGCGEGGHELDFAFNLTVFWADTKVAACEKDRKAFPAELPELIAQGMRIIPRAVFLEAGVRHADRRRSVDPASHVGVPDDVRVIPPQGPWVSVVIDHGGRVRHGRSILDVYIR